MTGYTSIEMVNYYNRKVLNLALASPSKTGAAVADNLFK
jgi:hypothetical protein